MDIIFVPPEEFKYAPEFCKDCQDYRNGCDTCSQLITLKQDLANGYKMFMEMNNMFQ